MDRLENIKLRWGRYGELGEASITYLIEQVEALRAENERLREREEIHWPYELDMAQREIIRLGGTVETNDGIALQA